MFALLRKTKRMRTAVVPVVGAAAIAGLIALAEAHIIPPEQYHPVAESYRRMTFMLNLNPVLWDRIEQDAAVITDGLATVSAADAEHYRDAVGELLGDVVTDTGYGQVGVDPVLRKETARKIFEYSTRAVSRMLRANIEEATSSLDDYSESFARVNEARQLWASFEHEVKATDRMSFVRLGRAWLDLTSDLGTPGVLSVGYLPPKTQSFLEAARDITAYVDDNFGEGFETPVGGRLAPLPRNSDTYNPEAEVPVKLPPGSNINTQVPRPRQILNMVSRGVDESETALIALGDMAFDSAFILGGPARELQITCNTCHNKGVTNPQFVIPGLSSGAGGVDISSSFFAAHANNGHFDPKDIPDLRGIRFTAPYGRNGRFPSLREFVRNGVIHEFDGAEPDPLVLDAMIAYMNEFDFLPNPYLNKDGTLNDTASDAAKRGEKLFNKPFRQMSGMSCATCHVPADHFLDHKSHGIGTVAGAEPYSLDRAMDTPTLLSSKFTAPYFHDGSQPTLGAVVEWFDDQYKLGLSAKQIGDLTAYLETVGDGMDAYEDTPYYLDAEVEEFSFFLSTYEYLKAKDKRELMNITFETIADELRNHKWELQDQSYIPVMDRLAVLMDEAMAANRAGDFALVDAKVSEYRRLYQDNVDYLK